VTACERAAGLLLALATVGAAFIAGQVWPRLFDSTPPGRGRLAGARCGDATRPGCAVEVLELSRGRYWLEASDTGADRLSFEIALSPSEEPPRALLLATEAASLQAGVEHAGDEGSWRPVEVEAAESGPRRRVLHLAGLGSGDRVRVSLARPASDRGPDDRLRVEEVGLFASERGLRNDDRSVLKGVPDGRLYNGILARACLWLAGLGTLAAFFPGPRRAPWVRAAFVLCLTLAATSLELWLVHNPYWNRARDLRVMLASGPVQEGVGANLNYGMHLGSRLLRGEGLTFGPGWVPWERMPGYGLFGALAGLVAGFRTDIFTIGLVSIQLHLLLFGLANAAFAAAAGRVMHPGLATAAAVLVVFMPNQLANTQADSIMVPVYLLTAAALCLYAEAERKASSLPPLRVHLLVHLSFALWFLMRPEGVVGWAALSLILYWRRLRYLALPVSLYLAIGVSWGAYKYQYTGEFSTTTNTVGDNAWISLWQAPSKFRWETRDASYFEWESHLDVPPRSKRASDAALREVARFALTYPVYVGHVALHKLLKIVDVDAFNAPITFPRVTYERLRGATVWALLGVVAACLLVPHERRRTLLLAWPLLFNLPLFLFFFSDGMRHIAPCSAALLVSAVPPLLELRFYRALARRLRLGLGIAVAFVVLWFLLHRVDRELLASDRVRYWTPFLDPAPFAWYLR